MSVYSPNSYSSILIVGTEDYTTIRLKFTQTTYVYMSSGNNYVYSYREYSYVIHRLQTMYIYPYYNHRSHDMSGTRIVSNKPVSVFSGHRCAYVPYGYGNCGYLIEQIPPTIFWGTLHYIAPLATRRTYTLKVLAAHDSTSFIIYCNNTARSYSLNEQGHTYITYENQEYCAVHSSEGILVAQFSGRDGEDPSMTLVPASNSFLNKFQFPTFNHYTTYSAHYINIIVMAQYYQSDKIFLITTNGFKYSLKSKEWTPIRVSNTIEAYATKVHVLQGVVEIIHTNVTALMTALVYGIDQRNGYIHSGGSLYSAIGE